MRFKLTALNITAMLFIAGCIIYTLINYATLSGGEGWGIVLIFGLIGFGLSALLVDFTVRLIFRRSKNLQLAAAIITVIYIIVFFVGL